MSYEIEKQRIVFSIALDGNPFKQFIHIYAHSHACNNVFPRHFHWSVAAITREFEHAPHTWSGNILVPQILWSYACDADSGCIKQFTGQNSDGAEIPGLEYIQLWKDAAKTPHKWDAASIPWKPSVYCRHGEVPVSIVGTPEWQRLSAKLKAGDYGSREMRLETPADFLDACAIFQRARFEKSESFIFHITDYSETLSIEV